MMTETVVLHISVALLRNSLETADIDRSLRLIDIGNSQAVVLQGDFSK